MDRLTGEFKGASMFATVEQAMQYNRLAQYENTGLTPDEIAALRAEHGRLTAEREFVLRLSDAGLMLWRNQVVAALEKDARADPAPRYHPCQRCGTQAPCPNGCERQKEYDARMDGREGAESRKVESTGTGMMNRFW